MEYLLTFQSRKSSWKMKSNYYSSLKYQETILTCNRDICYLISYFRSDNKNRTCAFTLDIGDWLSCLRAQGISGILVHQVFFSFEDHSIPQAFGFTWIGFWLFYPWPRGALEKGELQIQKDLAQLSLWRITDSITLIYTSLRVFLLFLLVNFYGLAIHCWTR